MTLLDQIELLKKYLLMKFEQGDWHGVMDAAADLRELQVKRDTMALAARESTKTVEDKK